MANMQNVNFKSIEEFWEYIPEKELELVKYLRKIIFDCIPNCKESLSYNVPYYSVNKKICFIWPSSITWGYIKTEGVRLGFTQGYLLRDEIGYLDKENRKQIRTKDFMSIKEIDVDVVKTFLFEAKEIDASFKKKK
ncbi:MAG: DUF1801 domain-containing protein [Bacteroidia bacterium]|nr:DUF1801 domain-containing protein [Bacteroidia bacterium]